jgi:hypothetical protein
VGRLSFDVREIHQTASGGSHVVIYSAEIELLDVSQPLSVEVLTVDPPDSPADAKELGRQMVQRGAVRAFAGTGKAARIRVRDFVIHPVDFKPKRVEEYTFRAIRGVLAGVC